MVKQRDKSKQRNKPKKLDELSDLDYLDQLQTLDKIKIGYTRVSSLDDRQKLGLSVQTEALQDCDIIFSEKQSGDNDNRPELACAIKLAKDLASQGKTVTFKIYKLDRLIKKDVHFSQLNRRLQYSRYKAHFKAIVP